MFNSRTLIFGFFIGVVIRMQEQAGSCPMNLPDLSEQLVLYFINNAIIINIAFLFIPRGVEILGERGYGSALSFLLGTTVGSGFGIFLQRQEFVNFYDDDNCDFKQQGYDNAS